MCAPPPGGPPDATTAAHGSHASARILPAFRANRVRRYHVGVTDALPFWRAKTLDAMTRAEWESLCDGCGRCCLHKLRDDDTDRLAFTNVACRLLDGDTCRCKDYANRKRRVPDCVKLTPARVAAIDWLPPTCAYRLVRDGKDLAWWHPLVSGRAETVHEAGVSVRGRVVAERDAGDFEDHVVSWPGRWPAGARNPTKARKAR